MHIAVMPDSSTDAAPSFTNVTATIGRYTAADRVAFAVGSTGNIFMATVNGSGTLISQITPAATAAALTASVNSLPQPTHSMATSGTGLIKLSTLGTATPQALVTHLVDSATVSFTAGALVSGTWTMSSGVEGSNQANSLTLNGMSALSGNCGQNGNTPLVASIAPEAPSGSDVLAGFEVVGTIGQCMFVFNPTGSDSLLNTNSSKVFHCWPWMARITTPASCGTVDSTSVPTWCRCLATGNLDFANLQLFLLLRRIAQILVVREALLQASTSIVKPLQEQMFLRVELQ